MINRIEFTPNPNIEVNKNTFKCINGGGHSTIRLKEYNDSGKLYYEFYIDEVGNNDAMYCSTGLSNNNMAGWLGQSNSLGYWFDGTVSCVTTIVPQNSNTAHNIKLFKGDTISYLLDLDNYKLTIRRNNTFLCIELEDLDISVLKSDKMVSPTIVLYNQGDQVTINFGTTPFKYKIPEGYIPYIISNRFLINQNESIYTIDKAYYNTSTKKYNPMNVDITASLENIIKTDGFSLYDINLETTKGDETFKPIDKFENYKLIKYNEGGIQYGVDR